MTGLNDVAWEPQPLPDVLAEQLRSHGFQPSDSAEVARQIGEAVGPAASASLFVDLGACNFLDGDIDGAIASWRRAVASGQAAPGGRALLNLGLLYEHLHLYERAISVFRSAAERGAEPFATEAAIGEARCESAQGDSSAAVSTLARLTENLMVNQPRSGLLGQALLQLGHTSQRAGRPDRAERAWKAAASSHLPSVQNSANDKLIALLVELGRDDEARQVIDESTTRRSVLTAAQRLHRAELLIRLGRGANAVELLATVRGDQLTTSERFRLAEVLLGQGLINESIDHLESLIELPLLDHRMRARYVLADVYRSHGMMAEAEEMFVSVIDSDHRYWSPKAGLQLGDVHDERGEIEAAVGLWVRAASSPVQEVREHAEARLTDRVTSSLSLARSSVPENASVESVDSSASDGPHPLLDTEVFDNEVEIVLDDDGRWPDDEVVEWSTSDEHIALGEQADTADQAAPDSQPDTSDLLATTDIEIDEEPPGQGSEIDLPSSPIVTAFSDQVEEPDGNTADESSAPSEPVEVEGEPVSGDPNNSPVPVTQTAGIEIPDIEIPSSELPALDTPSPVTPALEPAAPHYVSIPRTNAPTVIPLRVSGLQTDFIAPSRVEAEPLPAEESEPFVVALGAVHTEAGSSSSADPFAELAPHDANEIDGDTARSDVNPYAELSPVNLVAENHLSTGTPPDELRWGDDSGTSDAGRSDTGDDESTDDESSQGDSSPSGFFSSHVDD